MESYDTGPIDVRRLRQIREKLVLRWRGREYHHGFATIQNRTSDLRRYHGRRGLAHLRSRLIDVNIELAGAKVSLQAVVHWSSCFHIRTSLINLATDPPAGGTDIIQVHHLLVGLNPPESDAN